MSGYRRNGNNAFAYLGVQATTPPQMIVQQRKPTPTDVIGYTLGTLWFHIKPSTPTKATAYILSDVQQNVATWITLNGTSGGGGISAITVQTFTTTGAGTYTPTDGMVYCFVECMGGGGAGGTATGGITDATAGGGGGGYCKSLFTATAIGTSQSLVVGAGGLGSIVVGSNGADTTFGSLLTAGGGKVGGAQGGAGGTATGGNIINIQGGKGAAFLQVQSDYTGSVIINYPGIGGNSSYGFGGDNAGVPNRNGQLYGGGGCGAATFGVSSPNDAGGNGADGIIIITEYIS